MQVPPLLVDVVRGDLLESRHLVTAVLADAAGRVVWSAGDPATVVSPRSAVKPLQAIPLVASGAAEAAGLGPAELALACASHGGEPRHVALVEGWLDRIGCRVDDLVCGPQPARLGSQGSAPTRLHNNCSGKHAGFLTLARHHGWPIAGYHLLEHPVQQAVVAAVATLAQTDLTHAPRGTDGCGIPVLGLGIGSLAAAMARFALPGEPWSEAAAALRAAMAAEPFLVSGTGGSCTAVLEALAPAVIVKVGAAGVYVASGTDPLFGLALKVHDGADQVASFTLVWLLDQLGLLDDRARRHLAHVQQPVLTNWAGDVVGELRMAGGADGPTRDLFL